MTSGFGISVLVPQTSFHGETVGGIAKCWLFFFFFSDRLLEATGLKKNLFHLIHLASSS